MTQPTYWTICALSGQGCGCSVSFQNQQWAYIAFQTRQFYAEDAVAEFHQLFGRMCPTHGFDFSYYLAVNDTPEKAWEDYVSQANFMFKPRYQDTVPMILFLDLDRNRIDPSAIAKMKRINMPDGTDGLICLKCANYFPWVESNCVQGYLCYNCRDWI